MNKSFKRYLLVDSLFATLFILLSLLIPFTKLNVASFVIVFIFALVAFAVQPLVAYYCCKDNNTLKSKFYSWPILKVGFIYLFAQLIISILIYVLGAFFFIKAWIPLLICLVLAILTMIGLISTKTYKDEVERIESAQKETIKLFKNIKIELEFIVDSNKEESIRKDLDDLVELVKYSDPVSSDATNEIEQNILENINNLKELLTNAKFVEAKNTIENLVNLVNKRNKICKLNK